MKNPKNKNLKNFENLVKLVYNIDIQIKDNQMKNPKNKNLKNFENSDIIFKYMKNVKRFWNLKKGIATCQSRINKGLEGKKLVYALRYIKGAKTQIKNILKNLKNLKNSDIINNEMKLINNIKKGVKALVNKIVEAIKGLKNKKVESVKTVEGVKAVKNVKGLNQNEILKMAFVDYLKNAEDEDLEEYIKFWDMDIKKSEKELEEDIDLKDKIEEWRQ